MTPSLLCRRRPGSARRAAPGPVRRPRLEPSPADPARGGPGPREGPRLEPIPADPAARPRAPRGASPGAVSGRPRRQAGRRITGRCRRTFPRTSRRGGSRSAAPRRDGGRPRRTRPTRHVDDPGRPRSGRLRCGRPRGPYIALHRGAPARGGLSRDRPRAASRQLGGVQLLPRPPATGRVALDGRGQDGGPGARGDRRERLTACRDAQDAGRRRLRRRHPPRRTASAGTARRRSVAVGRPGGLVRAPSGRATTSRPRTWGVHARHAQDRTARPGEHSPARAIRGAPGRVHAVGRPRVRAGEHGDPPVGPSLTPRSSPPASTRL